MLDDQPGSHLLTITSPGALLTPSIGVAPDTFITGDLNGPLAEGPYGLRSTGKPPHQGLRDQRAAHR
jgi:hypothetical protein